MRTVAVRRGQGLQAQGAPSGCSARLNACWWAPLCAGFLALQGCLSGVASPPVSDWENADGLCNPCAAAAVILALRDIGPGEEVTLSYIGEGRGAAPNPPSGGRGPIPEPHLFPPSQPCLPNRLKLVHPSPSPFLSPTPDEEAPLEERREQLADYGFVCACDKCSAEELAAELACGL